MQEVDNFVVVRNDEAQYSIWPAGRPLPQGWTRIGAAESREKCLEYIRTHWTDMRPASLRNAMDEQGRH